LDRILGQDFGQVAKLAGGSAELERVATAGDRDAGGVIASVFEAGEALHDDGDAGLGSDVTDDSTHRKSVEDRGLEVVRGWLRAATLSGFLCAGTHPEN
jgi:hypothetical protein